MKFLDHLTFRRPDGTFCRAWFAHDAGNVSIVFVDGGSPGKVSVEIARACADGIFEEAENYTLNQMDQNVLLECRNIASNLL